LKFALDWPQPAAYTRERTIRFEGWAFSDRSTVDHLALSRGGNDLCQFQVGVIRPDVGDALQNRKANYAGYRSLAFLPSDTKGLDLTLSVQLANGVRIHCATLRFDVSHPEATGQERQRGDTSQHGEARVLLELVKEDWPRFLVDVGAHDGLYLSNSYPFICKGFRGLLFEPLPSVFAQLVETHYFHPQATCLPIAVSDFNGRSRLFVGADGDFGMNSSLSVDENAWFQSVRSQRHVEVDVKTLTSLLEQYEFPRDFSILLVDAEGMDYEVLKGLDFTRFRPRLILTEEYLFNLEKHQAKWSHLLAAGYVFLSLIGCNALWASEELLRSKEGQQVLAATRRESVL
jgi:FkbM family methyltransferase